MLWVYLFLSLFPASGQTAVPTEMVAAAEQGGVEAQLQLGRSLQTGADGEKDLQKANYWFLAAARNGNVEAQEIVAFQYADGDGVERSPEKAVFWFKKLADRGHATGQYRYGWRCI